MVIRLLCFFFVSSIFAAVLSGCSQMPSDPPKTSFDEEFELPVKVAILPFSNRTSTPGAGNSVRKMFYNFFSSLNYHDLEPAIIDRTLQNKGLYDSVISGDPVSVQRVGQLLGVDSVVRAEVLDYGKTYAFIYTHTSIRLQISMIDCLTGKTIWEIEHESRIREGDVPLSLTGMAGALIKTAISYNQASLLHTAAKLCLEVVDVIPNPKTITEPPPDIRYLVHNGGNQLFKPGERLKVIMVGEPNLEATWDVDPLYFDFPMKEREAGIYAGSYIVSSEDRLSYGRIVGKLKNKEGNESHWVDVLGPVAFGKPTLLPAEISKSTVLSREKSPYKADHPVIIPRNVTLTISPGTVVWFKKFGFGVRGSLNIRGSPEAPVRIYGLGSDAWKGIILDSAEGKNTVSFCRISGALYGLRAYGSEVSLDHCLLTDNTWNMVLEESSCSVSKSVIRSAQKAGFSLLESEAAIKDSLIVDNKTGGLLLEKSRLIMTDCGIFNNGRWDMRSADNERSLVQAAQNWWGTADEAQLRVQGEFELSPVHESPPEFEFMQTWINEPL